MSSHSSIIGIETTSSGVTVILSKNSFHVHHPINNDSSSSSHEVIDTFIHPDQHYKSCETINAVLPLSESTQYQQPYPNVLVSSLGVASSWKYEQQQQQQPAKYDDDESQLKTKNGGYQLVSRVEFETPSTTIHHEEVIQSSHLSPCKSALTLVYGKHVAIIAIAVRQMGLCYYTHFEHDANVSDASIISSKEGLPWIMTSITVSGRLLIWDVVNKMCIHNEPLVQSMLKEPSYILSRLGRGGEGRKITPHRSIMGPWIDVRYHEEERFSFLGYVHNNGFRLFSFQIPHSVSNCSNIPSPPSSAVPNGINPNQNTVSINEKLQLKYILQPDDTPISVGFIQNDRMFIILSQRQICIIDCLQGCVIKRFQDLSSQMSILSCNENISSHEGNSTKCSTNSCGGDDDGGIDGRKDDMLWVVRASISYPFISLISNGSNLPIVHKLDASYALAGELGHSTCHYDDDMEDGAFDEVKPTLNEEHENNRVYITYDEEMMSSSHAYDVDYGDRDNRIRRDVFMPLIAQDEDLKFLERHSPPKTYMKENSRSHLKSNRNITSSGYGGVEPVMKLGQGPLVAKKKAKNKALHAKRIRMKKKEKLTKMLYPINCGVLDTHQPQHDDNDDVPNSSLLLPAIATISYDPYGEHLACACKDNSIHVFNLPFSSYKPPSHQMQTNYPNHCDSNDYTNSKISSPRPSWSHCRQKLAYQNKIFSVCYSSKCMDTEIELNDKATNATFYGKDRFLVYSEKNKLYVQEYYTTLHTAHQQKQQYNHGDSFKTCINESIRKTPENKSLSDPNPIEFEFAALCHIVSITALNEVKTNIIGCACNDNTLHILDPIQGKSLWSRSKASGETSKMSSIVFPLASPNIPVKSESYNLLLTIGTDKNRGIGRCKLWDIRSGTVASAFSGHTNRYERCMGSFSPCCRYIGVGSEGNCAYALLYDIRMAGSEGRRRRSRDAMIRVGKHSSFSHYLSSGESSNTCNGSGVNSMESSSGIIGFKDQSITDVQFNPLFPQMATASLSGRIRMFTTSTP